MRRALGSFETALTLSGERSPFVVVLVLQLEEGPPPERLRGALRALQRHHPLLGVRIVDRAGGFAYEPEGTPPVSLAVIERRGDEHWRQVVEDELDRPLDRRAGPLLRCTYRVASPEAGAASGRAELVLTFHHAVMDAASAATFLDQLLRLCDAGSGTLLDRPAVALPPVEALFPPAFRGLRGAARRAAFLARQAADEAAFRARSRGRRRPPVIEPPRCRVLPVALPREETAALVRRSRRERVTLHGVLQAAMLLAVHRHLYGDGYDGRPGPLRYLTFADLRPHLDPPVSADSLGSYLVMLRYSVPRMPGRDGAELWPLARRVTAQVTEGLRRGDRFSAVAFAAPMMRRVLAQSAWRMGATALSYTGAVRVAPRYGPTRVLGVRSFVSNLAQGPEYTAQARLFDGALLLDVLYLEGDMDAARAGTVTGDVLDTLRSAGR